MKDSTPTSQSSSATEVRQPNLGGSTAPGLNGTHPPEAQDATPQGATVAAPVVAVPGPSVLPVASSALPQPRTAPESEDEEAGLDPRELLMLLLRRRRIIIATFLIVLVSGVLWTLSLRPIYQSTATLLVNVAAGPAAGESDLPIVSDLIGKSRARSLETQVEFLKSTPIRQAAFERLTPKEKSAVFVSTTITPVRSTDIVSIVVQSYDAQAAQSLANATGKSYIEYSQVQNRRGVSEASKYVSEQLKTVRGRLNDAQLALKSFKQRHGTVDLSAESQGRIAQLGEIQSALREAQTERAANAAQLSQSRAAAQKIAPAQIIPTGIVRRPTVEFLKAELTRLELERLAALQEYTRGSPEVRRTEGQVSAIQARLRREAQTEVATWQRTLDPTRQSLLQDAAKSQSQIWALDARSRALEATEQSARAQLAQIPEREYQLGQLASEVAVQQQIFQMLNERYQTLRISEQAKPANAQIVSQAEMPGAPISPNKTRNALMAAVLGLLLALGLATIVDRLDDRVHSDEDAEAATHLPVLAHVPFFEEKSKQSLLGQTQGTNPLLESYRMLRANIAFSALDEPLRSVLVTSSQPNEGKSVSSLNLAIVMALSGKRVVLVDADLRRPTVHRLLGVPNQIGFTSVVAGQQPLSAALQETSIDNLQVLTSGPLPPNPPELLDSRAGRNCIRELMDYADFVVVDTPPAQGLSDAQVVATMVDGIIMVVSAREAGKREIQRTRELLAQSGTKLLGTILNKLPTGLDGRYGGYYGYGGYKYRYYSEYADAEKTKP